MEVVETKHVEDCFDGSFVYEVSFSAPITESFIDCIACGSELQYFPDFPRPFFRITDENFSIKGIEGNQTVRVIAYRSFEDTLAMIKDRMIAHNQQVTF